MTLAPQDAHRPLERSLLFVVKIPLCPNKRIVIEIGRVKKKVKNV